MVPKIEQLAPVSQEIGFSISLTSIHSFMMQFTFLDKILRRNESFINYLCKKTVFNYSNVLFLESKNVIVVKVINFSTIGSFTLFILPMY